VKDAAEIWRLVRDCDILDTNSCYAYLLICREFSATCLVAVGGDRLLGFVIGFIPPSRRETVFVWQIGAHATARRTGLGKTLLRHLLDVDACRRVRFLEATVTPTNTGSLRLFQSLAEDLSAGFAIESCFRQEHFDNAGHEEENLIRIGPFEGETRKHLAGSCP
jgi:L-2,4-diaminobutyric acid acetyltransferase